MSLIMFVCTGNLCRSPMATGLLRKELAAEGLADRHRVISAGVWAVEGRPASENAIIVMAERDIDISDHIARTISADDVAEADLILVMSNEHKQIICNTWPQYDWKVFLLSEMVGKRKSILDPYGEPLQEYRACADRLEDYIKRGYQRILELA
jgi:protein-tyrosine-phosphatase